ncbi:MAG: ATP-binding protein [Anaerolineae bacterium]|nr:ATP-binding protein [Anaerolineae bacterium]
MIENFFLDWSILAISLSNTIMLLWLGLTVLLNAERRTWGAWIAGGALLLGAVFFISHSAIFGAGFFYTQRLGFWIQVGAAPVILLPLSWYVVMLWYTGYWEKLPAQLQKRHRPWLYFTSFLGVALVCMLIYAGPIPPTSYEKITRQSAPGMGSIVSVIMMYPFFILLCIGLSLDVLRNPGHTERVMGNIARRRARPWLIGTSLVFLAVGLLVAWALIWGSKNAFLPGQLLSNFKIVGRFDLMISSLISIAIILLGQAIVAYEIFTGKALPRRGFLRQWRRAIVLAFGYGTLVSLSLNIKLLPIYILVLTALLMTIFYALFSWRTYTERERYIDNLRPFVQSQGLFEQLITLPTSSRPAENNLQVPFEALCREVLDTKIGYLVALGPLAPLVGNALTYPPNIQLELSGTGELLEQFPTPEPRALQIDPKEYSGASWAISLWSERGQIGLLLLGEKLDGGLYTQEEIEIAQTSSERIIDTKASTEIAQRLMVLQRQRMAESQIIDQRARRVLHDDVLQQLHTVMLKLVKEKSRPNGGTSEAIEILAEVHTQISDLLREMPTTSRPEISSLGLIGALKKVTEEEFITDFESIKWNIDFEAERQTQLISPLTAEVLFYATREAIRNAARHGRVGEAFHPLHLTVSINWDKNLEIHVEDDGVGVSTERNVTSGTRQGLALHSTMMAVVGGELAVESEPGEYTRVSLTLPQGS